MGSNSKQAYYDLRIRAGLFAIDNSPTESVSVFGFGKAFHKYWKTKLQDPTFHSSTHGGKRYTKFGQYDSVVHSIVWARLKRDPTTHPAEVCEYLAAHNIQINMRYVQRLFCAWHWTRKKPVRHQINKYKLKNILYYYDFLWGIKDIPWIKLKFLDECHFVSKDSYCSHVHCRKGTNVILLNTPRLDQSFTLTFLTNLTNVSMPYFVTVRENSNTQWDFVEFVTSAILGGSLTPGDFLICDNASVHWAQDSWDALDALLGAAQVKMFFLPTYSPELNPCELVFGDLKKFLCGHRRESDMFWIALAKALARITFVSICDKYSHCLGKYQCIWCVVICFVSVISF